MGREIRRRVHRAVSDGGRKEALRQRLAVEGAEHLDDDGVERRAIGHARAVVGKAGVGQHLRPPQHRSEEHTSELQSLMRISYAVFCLKKKKKNTNTHNDKT